MLQLRDAKGLSGKIAIVTGGGRGIGRAIVREFAIRGAKVAVVARSEGEIGEAAEEASRLGGEGFAVKADVTSEAEVEAMVNKVLERFGRIDILVNNAGISIQKPILETTLDDWFRVINTNLTSAFLCSKAVGRVMIKQGGGVIINIASVHGPYIAIPRRVAYTASKAGLDGLTRAIAVEWARYGIRAVCVAPGWIATERVLDLIRRGVVNEDEIKRLTPMARLATPEEVAKVVAFLASDEASFINGVTVVVDGGLIAYGGPV